MLAMQISQTAACNRLHDIERRLARWLLMAQDRVDDGVVPITHDFLATMLGTDRPSLSVAAASLQRKKIIDYTRGTGADSQPQESGSIRLRVLSDDSAVQWRD